MVNYGLLADSRGCPVAVSVFEGSTADPKTLLPQMEKLRDNLGIASLVIISGALPHDARYLSAMLGTAA